MGILKSLIYGEAPGEVEQNFSDYTETFGKKPALITCDMNFINLLPSPIYNCCVKVQMDVFADPESPTLISESEASHLANIRSILSEHIGGRFVGQGVIGATNSAFLMFYIPERQSRVCKKMLTETFTGSFRHVETDIIYDPEGTQYKKYLYPNALQKKKISNMKMLRSLKGYGDDGTQPRPVKFNLVFQNKKMALSCYSESMEKGFVYRNLIEEEPPEGAVLPRHRLVIEKTIPFDINLLMLVDDYLLKLAEKYNGEYRSLETDVIEIK